MWADIQIRTINSLATKPDGLSLYASCSCPNNTQVQISATS